MQGSSCILQVILINPPRSSPLDYFSAKEMHRTAILCDFLRYHEALFSRFSPSFANIGIISGIIKPRASSPAVPLFLHFLPHPPKRLIPRNRLPAPGTYEHPRPAVPAPAGTHVGTAFARWHTVDRDHAGLTTGCQARIEFARNVRGAPDSMQNARTTPSRTPSTRTTRCLRRPSAAR